MSDQDATTPAGPAPVGGDPETQQDTPPDAAQPTDATDGDDAEVRHAPPEEEAGPDEVGRPPEEEVDGSEDDGRSRQELLEALALAQRERDEYLKDLQRLQAEFDNFRKRTMREGASQRAAGVVELTGKLLDVLDDFDMALMSVGRIRPAPGAGDSDDVTALHKGLELVYSKFISTLKGVGLERIDSERVPFDPERHEAVQQVDAEHGPHDQPMVVDVLRPGYQMQGRVIRPAMVKVAQ